MQGLLCALVMVADSGQAAQALAPASDRAPAAPTAPDAGAAPDAIVVTARRGAAALPPESELGGRAIETLHAYDIGEVLRRTAQLRALGEDPLVIVNGRRVADPGIFSNFPPDALERVEVLPRAAGARYGGDPRRRVVNIVLQPRYASRDGEAEAKAPSAGGASDLGLDIRQGSIAGIDVTQFGVQASRASALRAAARPVYRRAHPGTDAVTLRPSSRTLGGNLALTRALGRWSSSLHLVTQLQWSGATLLSGDRRVQSRTATQSLSVTAGLTGDWAGWSIQSTLSGEAGGSRLSDLGSTRSTRQSLTAALSANRTLFTLPAGAASVSLSAQTSLSRSRTRIDAGAAERPLTARDAEQSGTVSLPIWRTPPTGRRPGLARLFGTLTASLGGTLRQSDAGRGQGLNAGLSWAPLDRLSWTADWARATDSVPVTERFAPVYRGTPITVLDLTTGQSALVVPILGGTPGLRAPRFERRALSLSAGPFGRSAALAGISLQQSEEIDSIGPLPAVTAELERAFADRFQRDAAGRLVALDQRPINLALVSADSLGTNLSLGVPIGKAMPDGSRGTLRLTVNNSLQLRSLMTVHPGLPQMDRLAGDGGGAARHQLELNLDGQLGRWGLNMAAHWRGGYRVRRENGRNSPGDLRIAALGTVDLRLNYRLERALRRKGEGGSARRAGNLLFDLEIANLFDARPAARLEDGAPAPGYGHDDQDPLGRTIRLSVKGRF
ncbi:TonB-dependent receptor plug domain-containing protein [Sphingomonas morindae]|uniref:TonB-dependent receptor plug domain-containing protein n=1 Tax=Sphingomonas morindae TaxID=1541170 RepID=A0ABY4XCH0_9SPHN|nr:TonB-dependent receptor plug domain-containing protein [Sphingomonas morindae]USI74665.1 TonB-dependent receptor plug domain-containing protein [Sphingomonas morindae]